MAKPDLYERIIPINSSEVRIVCPIDTRGADINSMGNPLIVHPGWGKKPEQLVGLLHLASDAGFVALGLDTRHSWPTCPPSMQRSNLRRREQLELRQSVASKQAGLPADNYLAQRRVLATDQAIDALGIEHQAFLGHSKGFLILLQVALGRLETTDQFISVNGAGTGDSWHAYRRLMRSNLMEFKAALEGEQNLAKLAAGGLASTAYALAHGTSLLQEKRIIQAADGWPGLGLLASSGIPTAAFMAEDDYLVGYTEAAERSLDYPAVHFVTTPGRHTNIYLPPVQAVVVRSLVDNVAH